MCFDCLQETAKAFFDIKLEKIDEANKVKIIKEIRAVTPLSLKEVCDLLPSLKTAAVSSMPCHANTQVNQGGFFKTEHLKRVFSKGKFFLSFFRNIQNS